MMYICSICMSPIKDTYIHTYIHTYNPPCPQWAAASCGDHSIAAAHHYHVLCYQESETETECGPFAVGRVRFQIDLIMSSDVVADNQL